MRAFPSGQTFIPAFSGARRKNELLGSARGQLHTETGFHNATISTINTYNTGRLKIITFSGIGPHQTLTEAQARCSAPRNTTAPLPDFTLAKVAHEPDSKHLSTYYLALCVCYWPFPIFPFSPLREINHSCTFYWPHQRA